MKLIKLIVISIIILFIIATLLGLLFPSKVIVSRAIDIQKPATAIQKTVANIGTWKFWFEGANDSTFKQIDSKTIMLGNSKVIVDSVTTKSVYTTWLLVNNTQQKSVINVIESGANRCIVQWQFEQHLQWYPWERFASMLSDKIIGTMMEKNLHLLQKYATQ